VHALVELPTFILKIKYLFILSGAHPFYFSQVNVIKWECLKTINLIFEKRHHLSRRAIFFVRGFDRRFICPLVPLCYRL